jgi:hypothetical protein
LLSDIRRRLLLSTDHFEIRRMMYELEGYLAVQPHSVDGKMLLFQIRRVLINVCPAAASQAADSQSKFDGPKTEWGPAPKSRGTRIAALGCLLIVLSVSIALLIWWVTR